MQTIPREVIDTIWQNVLSIPPEKAEQVFQKVLKDQPFLSMYLLQADEELLPPDEQGSLMMMGYCIIRVMTDGKKPLRQVSGDDVEAADQANIASLENLEEGSEVDFQSAVQQLIQHYNQAPLVGYVLEALMEGNEDEPDQAPDNIGMLFLHLKTIIDCLDQE